MLVFVGLLMLLILAVVLVTGKAIPSVPLSILPVIGALAVGTAFPKTMMFVAKGMITVLPVAALFAFSIIYFSIMSDTGLFDRIVKFLVKRIGGSVYSVLCVTAIITMISHLDGSGVSTILITLPAMLPVFIALKIRREALALTMGLSVAAMNIVPWGGPTARAAAVIGVDPAILWRQMIPIQLVGLALVFVVIFFLARIEMKRGEFAGNLNNIQMTERKLSEEEAALKRPQLWWANLVITIILLAALIAGVPSFVAFMVGCAIVIPLNYHTPKEQEGRIKAHAKNVLPVIFIILGAGALLGVLNGTGMLDALASALLSLVPEFLTSYMHVIIGVLTTPLSILLDADTMMFGMLPIVVKAVGAVGATGASSASVASIFVIGHNYGIGLCMTSASVYFGLGMIGLEYKAIFKYSVLWKLGIGTLMILLSAVIIR